MTTSARGPSVRVQRQRRLAALGALLILGAILTGVILLLRGGGSGAESNTAARETPKHADAAPKPPELPRGGRRLLPDFRILAYYGAPQDAQLGALGIGTPAHAIARLERQAKPYARKTRPVLPVGPVLSVVRT